MRINSIGVMPQNNIINSQSNKNVAFKGFTSSVSAEDIKKTAEALKGQKGWDFLTDGLISETVESFNGLVIKLKEKFEHHPKIDLHLFRDKQTLWASLVPSNKIKEIAPEKEHSFKLLYTLKNNFMFSPHAEFLKEINDAAQEMQPKIDECLQGDPLLVLLRECRRSQPTKRSRLREFINHLRNWGK